VNDDLPNVSPWSQAEISRQEKAAVGFYLTVHPLDGYLTALSDLKILNIADYEDIKAGDYLTLSGIVSAVQVKYSKKGNRFCIFRLEDQSSGVKCLTWSEAYEKYSSYLKDDELLIVEGRVESADGQEITLIVNDVRSLGDAIPSKARKMSVTLPREKTNDVFFDQLCSVFNTSHGRCAVYLNMKIDDVEIKMEYQPNRVQGSRKLERDLTEMGCAVEWVL